VDGGEGGQRRRPSASGGGEDMSGSWAAGSPMKSVASSGSRSRGRVEGEPLPLIDCPKCRVPIVQLRSKKLESYGKIFYKCPNNYPVSVIHTIDSLELDFGP